MEVMTRGPWGTVGAWRVALAAFLAGALLGWLVLPVRSGRPVPPKVVTGEVTKSDATGLKIGFTGNDGNRAGYGYRLAGAQFLHKGTWSTQTCVEPLTSGQPIRMGVVHPADSPRPDIVVWLECL
jgi:hypothetical protein